MKTIKLHNPHYFLLFKGRKQSVASESGYPVDEPLLVVSNGAIKGTLILGSPSHMNLQEFDKRYEEHRVRESERQLFWPEAEVLVTQRIKSWHALDNEKLLDAACQKAIVGGFSKGIIDKVASLPKTIETESSIVLGPTGEIFTTQFDDTQVISGLKSVLSNAQGLPGHDVSLYDIVLTRRKLPLSEFSALEAPGYRVSDNIMMTCDSCAFGLNSFCNRYNFFLDSGYVCNSYEYFEEKDNVYLMLTLDSESSLSLLDQVKNFPENSERIDPEEYHITLAYFGQVENKSFKQPLSLILNKLCEEMFPLSAEVSGLGIFNGQKQDVLYASIDSSALLEFRQRLTMALDHLGLKLDSTHGFTPHVTLAYLSQESNYDINDTLPKMEFALENLVMSWGGQKSTYPFDPKQKENMLFEILEEAKNTHCVIIKETEEKIQCFSGDDSRQKATRLIEALDFRFQDVTLVNASRGFAIKEINNEPWLVTWSSNAFQDRHGQFIETNALEDFVYAMERQEEKGFFNIWHIPGSDFAVKKWQAVPGRILVEAGPFLKDEKGQAALKFFSEFSDSHEAIAPEGWGCSIEFGYFEEDLVTNSFPWLWIQRTSVLPRGDAANIVTSASLKESVMAITQEQMEAARTIFGDELAKEIIEDAKNASQSFEQFLAYKFKDLGQEENETQEIIQKEELTAELINELFMTLETIAQASEDNDIRQAIYAIIGQMTMDNIMEQGENIVALSETIDNEELSEALRMVGERIRAIEPGLEEAITDEEEQQIDADEMMKLFGDSIKGAVSESLPALVDPVIERMAQLEQRVETSLQAGLNTTLPRSALSNLRASQRQETTVQPDEPLARMHPESAKKTKARSGADYYYGSNPALAGE